MRLFKRKNDDTEIEPNQDFLEGTTRYQKGGKYTVNVSLANYFRACGWLVDSDTRLPPPVVSIEIDDTNHGHEGGLDG